MAETHRLDHRSGSALENWNARDEVGRSGIYPASGPRPAGAVEVRGQGAPAPSVAVAATGAMLTAAGLSLISGVRPKIGASLTAAFLLGVSPVMHAFWREEGQERMNDTINFSKNMALVGGALLAASVPEPWPWAPRLAR